MKIIKFTILILALSALATSPCFAKNVMNEQSQSVQLLKTLTNEGKVIRQYDKPVEKADISEDTIRVKELKQKYYEENKRMLDVGKKNKAQKAQKQKKTKKNKKIPE